jgi:periplasmic protein CpxP/Spy
MRPMKPNLFPVFFAATFLSFLPSRSLAQGPGGGEGMGGGPPVDEMKQELNLTDDQVTKIRGIHKEHREANQAACLKAMNAKEDLREVLQSDATRDQAKKKFQEVRALKEKCMAGHEDEILAIRDVLTPEQRKQFSEMRPGHGKFGGAPGMERPRMGRKGRLSGSKKGSPDGPPPGDSD